MTKSLPTNHQKSDLVLKWSSKANLGEVRVGQQSLDEYFAFLEELNLHLQPIEKKAAYKTVFCLDP